MGRTGHHDDHEEEGAEEGGRKRIDLTASQVAGAAGATLAAATAASYLNVYGTVIGAAGMAALSTLVSPLLQHWFSRSGEQARQLAGRARAGGHAGAPVPNAPGAPVAPAPEGVFGTGPLCEVTEAGSLPEDSDATRVMALPPLEGAAGTHADVPGATARTSVADPDDPDPDDPDADGPGDGSRPRRGGRRRGWRSAMVPAVVVFVLAMLVILAFELFTGRSLTSWTRGTDEATAPTLFGGTTSAPPAEESGSEDPATTGEAPEGSDPRGEDGTSGVPGAPGDPQPTEPAPGGDGAEASPAPTAPPADDPETPEEPVEQAPDPGAGEQGGGEAVPAPEPPAPPEE
ncbi:ICP22 family protein [Nocardiopsis quinghaiensis]|uniref:hypothetical protein n=1 Tax=Nocardiopsis quinghaiensis TaxID=464995 RepID=UPI00123A4B2B|nr:hypothetical protein [Nocardiopsis quinghaiensis]